MAAPDYKLPAGVLLPLNFDRRPDVVLMTRAAAGHYPFLVWLEWANAREFWRPLQAEDPGSVDWALEDLTYVIESFVKWDGDPGGLMRIAVDSGLLQFEERGGRWGLVLADFARHNRHLDPYAGSVQSKGGRARGLRRQRELADRDARKKLQLQDLHAREGDLFLPEGRSRQQQQEAYALILRLDRACGLPTRAEWPEQMVSDAVRALGQSSEAEVLALLDYLVAHRDDPAVVKRPDRILANWETAAALAGAVPG